MGASRIQIALSSKLLSEFPGNTGVNNQRFMHVSQAGAQANVRLVPNILNFHRRYPVCKISQPIIEMGLVCSKSSNNDT